VAVARRPVASRASAGARTRGAAPAPRRHAPGRSLP
jgi:hypothetical protein